jgi:DNA-directed RNA polymerase beta' subunit
MILDVVVIPLELRPLVPLDGGRSRPRISTTCIARDPQARQPSPTPEVELRAGYVVPQRNACSEAVDALDNGRRGGRAT